MSFRKRNVVLGSASASGASSSSSATTTAATQDAPSAATSNHLPGTRPSPIDGRLTTSTGTPTLDNLLAGHAGLALGHSILLDENETTDYAGTLLKYYAAEGIVQGHTLHIVCVRDGWTRDLPGLVGAADKVEEAATSSKKGAEADRMKIAWRYEKLGQFGDVAGSRGPQSPINRQAPTSSEQPPSADSAAPFCHIFDLAKRLAIPSTASIHYIPLSSSPHSSPFSPILQHLTTHLQSSPAHTIHRVVIPTLLSPALYPPHASSPTHLLQFFHCLRSLLRQYPAQLTIMASLPLELYPRSTALIRLLEHLSDGVIELTPFPHAFDEGPGGSSSLSTSGAATAQEEQPQGLVKVHKLPVFHERGGGGGGLKGMGDDLSFTVSRRRFTIRPFSLPPAEGDSEAQKGNAEGAMESQKLTKDAIEF